MMDRPLQPLLLRKHVLIMSIVGTRDEPAPQLQAVRHRLSRSRLTVRLAISWLVSTQPR